MNYTMIKTIGLLLISNCFMLSAWYVHLKIKWLDEKSLVIASILSWCIAFFEYQFHIPANRIGIKVFSLEQLQIMQIGISLFMYIPFSIFIMNAPFKLNYIYASALILLAAYLIMKNE